MDLKRRDDWHLHLTVEPRTHEMARDYAAVAAGVSMRPTVIDNKMAMGNTYRELIPSLKLTSAELGEALVLLHNTAKYWAMNGWIVTRNKLEGRHGTPDTTIYTECHVETSMQLSGWAPSHSPTSGKHWQTIRAWRGLTAERMTGHQVEHCVYDSNRYADDRWLKAWGALTR